MSSDVTIYTDGSCDSKSRCGGWGAVVIIDGIRMEFSGSKVDTTNNRMELMAALAPVNCITTPSTIRIITDSKYVLHGVKTDGFTHKDPVDIKNYDLWVKMRDALRIHKRVKVEWVRGHSGDPLNERADVLAGEAMRKVRGY